MKLTAIILLAACLQVSARAYSQKATIIGNNISLKKVFKEIRKQTGYSFIYTSEDLSKASPVTLHMKDATVKEILNNCFTHQPLTYLIQGNIIVVKPVPVLHFAMMDDQLLPETEITGQVRDSASGSPLPGVTVKVKGTTIGTATDDRGHYKLEVPENAILIFSFIGYATQEISVNGRSEINVSMAERSSPLNELVTVGYGVQKKVDVTGAVSQISGKQLANRPVSNLEQALQGAIPGLNFSAGPTTGQPGGTYSVNIRGLRSFASGLGTPYVLVDGIPMDLNDVDPNNVKSISVLKDAASSAIYGARAAYGVILITTKNGANTPGLKVSYSYNYAVAQPAVYVHNVDALTYALAIDSAAANGGVALPYSSEAIDRIKQYMKDPGSIPGVYPNAAGTGWDFTAVGYGANANTDWYDALFRKNAIRQTHNINISGSGKNTSYALSAGIFHEDGVSRYANDQYTRKTLSGQLNVQPLPWLKAGLITKYVGSKDRNPNTKLVNRLAPTLPLHDPLGGFLNASNIPQAMAETATNDDAEWVIAPSVKIEPIKDWVTIFRYNYTYTGTQGANTNGVYSQIQPDSSISGRTQISTNYYATMGRTIYQSPTITSTYHRQIGNNYISALVGVQEELETVFDLTGNNTYLLTDDVPSISTAVGTQTTTDSKSHWATQSVFGRLNYNYKEKYLFEANVRRDGSSRFAPGSRWGTFPSVSVGYNIAKEKFFPFKNQISMMKFRFSWGAIGNQDVANYLYVPVMSTGLGNYLLGSTKSYIVNAPNETTTGLTWEKVNTKDIGLDMYVFDNKLSLTADWYQSDNTDLVGPGIVVPEIYGATVPKSNNGSLRTRGWEVEVKWRQSLSNSFSYFADVNVSNYRSVVTSFNNPLKLLSTYYVGQVLGTMWGFKTDGLFQSEEEVAKRKVDQSYIYNGAWFPGDVMYRDLNGDGVINEGKKEANDHGDLTVIGNSTPQYQYGVYAGADFKGFDLSFVVQGVGKWQQWPGQGGQNAYWGPTEGPGLGALVLQGQQNFWSYENKNAFWPRPYLVANNDPRINKNKAESDRYLQNRAYLRLKSLQVGYNLPTSLIKKIKASQLRIYFSGDNLLTRTKYRFFDPEVGGYDNHYPLQKVFSFGVNVTY